MFWKNEKVVSNVEEEIKKIDIYYELKEKEHRENELKLKNYIEEQKNTIFFEKLKELLVALKG